MIKCSRCKRITKSGQSTGLIITYQFWLDDNNHYHKDIVKIEKACMNCDSMRELKEIRVLKDEDR